MLIRFKVTDANRYSFPGRAIRYKYNKGQLVKSDVLGIFLFRRRKDAEDYIGNFQMQWFQDFVGPIGIEPPVPPLEIHRVEALGRGKRVPYCPVIIHNAHHELVMEPVVAFKNFVFKFIRTAPYVESGEVGKVLRFKGYDVMGCAPGTVTYPAVKVLD